MRRRFVEPLTTFALLLVSSFCVFAQPASPPVINKIDPPNWWPALPDPMLLVYGRQLSDAHFTATGHGVSVLRTQTSANGHYAFLWLATKDADPQSIEISASNAAGRAKTRYELKARAPARGRYQGFNAADVMYLIMTDRFADGDPSNDQPGYAPDAPRGWHGGDLRGIRQHLDYLQELGVTTLWTTPVLSNGNMPESYHGYAAVDLYAIDSHFGSLQDYQQLADDLHARGMKIVFDIVPNHIGVQHQWVHDPPTPDWFHGTFDDHTHVQANFEALVDPHATPADSFAVTQGWFTDGMPDMNQENPLVSTYFIQNAVWWIETAGLDGLRIDTFPYVGRAFWSEFHQAIHRLYPQLTTVGEVFNGDATITSYFAGGVTHNGIDSGLDTPFDFPTYFALRDVLLHDKPMTLLASVLAEDHLYPHPELLVPFFGNHDTMRFLSEPGATAAKLKLALALIATLRGMPEIYSGDEIAMEGKDDPDNRRDFPGGFASSTHNAFTSSGRTADEQAMFAWASLLFQMRKSNPMIKSGGQQDLFADSSSIAFLRGADFAEGCKTTGAPKRVLILVNKAVEPHRIEFGTVNTGLAGCAVFERLISTSPEVTLEDGRLSTELEPNGVGIYEVH